MTTNAPKKRRRAGVPEIVEMPDRKMAVVRSKGDPNEVGEYVFPALYGAVYQLKFARKKAGEDVFKISPLVAHWPDAHLVPKDEWTAIWGLPIPDDVTVVPAKVPEPPVSVETWPGGPAAQVLHIGPYDQEGPNVGKLHAFIAEQGYEIAGDHEEEYLTSPDAKVMRTMIRYPVRKRA